MTNTKKVKNATQETLRAYDDFLIDINNYFEKRIKDYDTQNTVILEKIQDKLYFKTTKKDIALENALKKKNDFNQKYQMKFKYFKMQLEDLKINKSTYEKKVNTFKLKYKNGKFFEEKYKKYIEKTNLKYMNLKEKLNSQHKKKQNLIKSNKVKFLSKEKLVQERSINNLKAKKEMVLQANEDYKNKLNISMKNLSIKMNIRKTHFKEKLDKNLIGIHTYNEKISYQDKKYETNLEKVSLKKTSFKPFVLNQEILRSKVRRLANENINKYFFPGVLKEMKLLVSRNKIIFIILILLFYTSLINSNFWRFNSLLITMKGNSEVIVMGFAMTMVILTGGIDLSVGSVMAFSGVIICSMADKTNIYLAIVIGILFSTLVGLFQGLLIGYARMVPFVVTLGGLLMFRSLSIIQADSKPIQPKGNAVEVLREISDKEILGLNIQIWIILISLVIFLFVLKFTVFGRQIYSIGSNRRAAFLSGVKDKRVEAIVYTISGAMAGLAGLLITSRTQSIIPTEGQAWELKAIAATVIGGTALTGGKGGVIGTFVGWIILSMMPTVFITLGYNSQIEKVATGLIIIIAVLFNNNLDFKSGFRGVRDRTTKLFKQYFARRKI